MEDFERNQFWVVNMEAELAPLLSAFIKNRWEDLSRLRVMIEIRDFPGLRKLGHNLLGPPGAFGFEYLVEIGRALQNAARLEDWEAAHKLAERYERFMCNHEVRLITTGANNG